MYDLRYDTDLISGQQGQILNQGEKVLTYKIKYYLPYIGLGADVLRQNCGVSLNLKYAICPSAEDVDNHPLRGLTFYGDYNKDGNVFMGSMNVFWNLTKKWKFRVGADATLVRIDGKTWDETHDPIWDADQSIDTKQFIYWTGLEYKF
jgi:outer membrane protease